MKLRRNKCAAFLVLVLLGLGSSITLAEDPPRDAERCIHLSRLDTIDILNDRQILFEMLGDDLYVNELPHRCPGLRHNSTIMYRTSIGVLCDVDIITLLEPLGGGLMPSSSCGLGKFYPISEDEADALREAAEK